MNTFAHSPDCDDAFMFYGIACGAVDTGSFSIKQVMKDIQTLNEEALEGKYDITAISFAAYPKIKSRYLLMPCGASFGLQYGPIVLTRDGELSQPLSSTTIAIPGDMTTAYLLLRLYLPQAKVIAMPFQEIIPALQNGLVEAGLVIHEGQLTYTDLGLKKIVDLGQWWYEKTNLPLPLGGNAIKSDLDPEQIASLTNIVRQSIVYALANRQAALQYALSFAGNMPYELADDYVNMYVNDLSVDCGEMGKQAVKKLFQLAQQAHIVDKGFYPEFVA